MLSGDIIETPDALKLKAALPGVDAKDVDIQVNDNILTLSAQRRHEEKVEEGSYHWIEQQYGTFSRSLALPRTVDTEKIEASYNNGILELKVPKKESSKPRRIALSTQTAESRTLEANSSPQSPPRQLQNQESST
jgi:HSP20 family protein